MPVSAKIDLRNSAAMDEACTRAITECKVGTVLRTPERVPAEDNGALLLTGYRVTTLKTAAQWPPFEYMAVLIGSHLESGQIVAAPAHTPATVAFNQPPAPQDAGEGFTGSVFRFDVADRLGSRPPTGTLCLWLIVRGEYSGPAKIKVFKPDLRPIEDPEVVKFLARWRIQNKQKPRSADPATVWPPEAVFGSHPSYRSRVIGPPVPAQGISIQAPNVVIDGGLTQWILSGSYRLRVARRHIVETPVCGYSTTAVVPITLVVTTNKAAGPVVLHLRLPSESPVAHSSLAPMVEGRFTLNLFTMPGMWREPGTYFIYAVCGDTLSAPAVTSLTTDTTLVRAG